MPSVRFADTTNQSSWPSNLLLRILPALRSTYDVMLSSCLSLATIGPIVSHAFPHLFLNCEVLWEFACGKL